MSDNERNVLLHQATVVGYIRVCLSVAHAQGSVSMKSVAEDSTRHLTRAEFASVRSMATIEICEFVKDGLLNGAARKIHDALEGRYDRFWNLANCSLLAMGYPPVEPSEIDPALLAQD